MAIDLSAFSVGQQVTGHANLKTGHTSPPSLFMEGDLIDVMDDIGRYANIGKEDMHTLKQANKTGSDKPGAGIGTARTRGEIVKKLFEKGYFSKITKNKKNYVAPTEKAIRLYQSLIAYPTGSVLVSPELTAKWEIGLEKIEKGDITLSQFMSKLVPMINEIVKEVMANPTVTRGDDKPRKRGQNDIAPHTLEGKICDKCEKGVLVTNLVTNEQSRYFGKRYVRCPECKNFGNFID